MVYAIDISQDTSFAPRQITDVSKLLNLILPLLTLGGALIFLAMSFYGGFLILTNGDNKEKIAEGHKTLGFAIVGLIVVISSFLLVKLVGYILGFTNILSPI